MAAGDASMPELIASIDNGLLIEGGIAGRSDPSSLRFTVRAARAREIVKGRRTGRLYGVVDIIGELPAFIGSIRAVSAETASIASHRRVATSANAPGIVARVRVVGGV
jgi:predicted Zn-dependent protease